MRRARAVGAPLYRQIASDLWEQIQSGRRRPGEQLPSESELGEEYGVNRLTLRQAILELQRLGAVEIRRGVGTFIVTPPDLVEIVATVPPRRQHGDLTQEALSRHVDGPRPTVPLRRVEERIVDTSRASGPLSDEAAEHLGVAAGRLLRLDTVMVRAGQNWIANSYWYPDRFPDIPELMAEHGLVVAAFGDGHGMDLSYRWRAFSAVAADFVEAELLGVQIGAALLVRDGVTAAGDDAVFYVRRRLRGDEAKFVLKYEDGEGPGAFDD